MNDASVFHLQRGETTLGVLRTIGGDMPWLYCKFEPTEDFAPLRPLFDREMELAETEDYDELEKVCGQIENLGLHLVFLTTGKRIDDFMLHIQNDEARFTTDRLALK